MFLDFTMDLGFQQFSDYSTSVASGICMDWGADGYIFRMDISYPFDPGSVGHAGYGWK